MKMKFKNMVIALVGMIATGCTSSDEMTIDTPQPQPGENEMVTLTTTISLGDDTPSTRALDATGRKTFVAGDQIAVFYKSSSKTLLAGSSPLTGIGT